MPHKKLCLPLILEYRWAKIKQHGVYQYEASIKSNNNRGLQRTQRYNHPHDYLYFWRWCLSQSPGCPPGSTLLDTLPIVGGPCLWDTISRTHTYVTDTQKRDDSTLMDANAKCVYHHYFWWIMCWLETTSRTWELISSTPLLPCLETSSTMPPWFAYFWSS